MKVNLRFWLALGAIFVLILACSPPATPMPVSPVTAIPPTLARLSLSAQVTLTSTDRNESSPDSTYTITAKVPALIGSDDPRVAAFNVLASSIVQQAVEEFKTNASSMPPVPEVGGSSSFNVGYSLLSSSLEFISIKFEMDGYIQGAAHPYHLSRTLNFDLEKGQEITLDSLFLPNSDYLVTIANYCAAQLKTRDIGFDDMFSQGASPVLENYHNWNITSEGLLITFDEYQVAAYAAGPQTVVVPYAELAALIAPQGSLAQFLP
jgi:hypothetical protein